MPIGAVLLPVDPQEFFREIGRRIASARKARGWTQTQLAEAVGSYLRAIQSLESGRAMTLTTIASLAVALNVPPADFLDGTEHLLGIRARRKRPAHRRKPTSKRRATRRSK